MSICTSFFFVILETEQLKSCFSDVVCTSIHPFFFVSAPFLVNVQVFQSQNFQFGLRLSLVSLKFQAQTCSTRVTSPRHHHRVVLSDLTKLLQQFSQAVILPLNCLLCTKSVEFLFYQSFGKITRRARREVS